MEKFNLVVAAFERAVEKANNIHADRRKKVENAWCESNQGLRPKMDSLGRLHSPCDGYSLCESLDFGPGIDPEKLYRKGEYLPNPISDDPDQARIQNDRRVSMGEKYASREKIKVDLELAKQIVKEFEFNSYIQFSHGNSWSVNGNEICYLYMTAIVQSAFKSFYEAVKSAIENNEKHEFTGSAYEGRVRVRGTVVKITEVSGWDYYYKTETVDSKLFIILDNDSTCYGNWLNNVGLIEVGDTVEFTATFTKANNSDHHSFYKRPHKPELFKAKKNEEE